MSTAELPPFLLLATLKTTTKTAQDRLLEIFPPLVAQSTDNEPDTLSYYLLTGAASDDHQVYVFETYPSEAALVDPHQQSETFKRQGAKLAEEKLCTASVDKFKPVSGFILRDGAVEKPVELIVMKKIAGSDTARASLQKLAEHVAKEEAADTPTFVVMEHLETGEFWTFERYNTKAFYEQKHSKSDAFAAAFGGANQASALEYVEAKQGFLLKQ